MARIIKRSWTSRGATGHKVKRVSYGFTVQIDGRQERRFSAEWDRQRAQDELGKFVLERDKVKAVASRPMTFCQAVERYLTAKSRKRSLEGDRRYLAVFQEAFGAASPLADITAARISAWKAERLAAASPRTKEPFAAASINRPLAALRHLLKLACEEWEVIPAVPRIRLEKEPQGRLRWLEPDDEARLLAACRTSRNRELADIVTVALESGLRKAELLGLTWDRIDMSRGVLRLEITKSGRRREVPMRQAVYDVLAGQSGAREGRVWRAGKIRTAFENAVEAAGLGDFVFHDTRHHFASWFVMRGGGLQALKEILGHQDIKMTLRYAHLAPDHLRQEVAKTERPTGTPMEGEFSTKSAHEGALAVDSRVGDGATG